MTVMPPVNVAKQNLTMMLHAWKFWGEMEPALRQDLLASIDWTYRQFRQPLARPDPLLSIDLLCEQNELYTREELVGAIRKIVAVARGIPLTQEGSR